MAGMFASVCIGLPVRVFGASDPLDGLKWYEVRIDLDGKCAQTLPFVSQLAGHPDEN